MTEKQRLFCIYYAQTLNQRKAARMAGYKSDKYGWDLIQNPQIRARIKEIKEDMNECNLINSWDILRMYIKIGFADIEEFIDIGTDENGESFINFKDEFDGQIVDEIQIRKGEPKIKLADRMKALEKLEKYFDLMGYEGLKKKIMEKKINMEKPVTNIQVVTGIDRQKEEEK